MQGFNKYYPPDFDPRQTQTLNDYRGVHALGKRAKDIDKGILVVRFELPFNIWCGSCNSHLGAGVRYNAQKRKVGAYYTTPIYAFRCKCHLCSGWFEIRTDPKNAQYVVEEGARKQESEWDPEENGGFAVHDTEAPSASEPPADPFSALDKTLTQKTAITNKAERLTTLTHLSERQNADPYTISLALRARHREAKKVDKERQGRDDELRARVGLGEWVELGEEMAGEGKEEWRRAQERRATEVGKGKGKGRATDVIGTKDLAKLVKENTKKRLDPFGGGLDAAGLGKATRGRSGVLPQALVVDRKKKAAEVPKPQGVLALDAYGSDEE